MFNLFPIPRVITHSGGAFTLPPAGLIALDCVEPAQLRFTAQRLREAAARAGCAWEIIAGPSPVPAQTAVILRVRPGLVPHPQGYRLTVSPSSCLIEANTEAGLFYGVCTLTQYLQSAISNLPSLHIEDWPDFPVRGVMVDVSRDKVPTMETLFALVDRLASWKINQLQLYTEHTFAYRRHPEVWAEASPLTGQEILDLDAYCRERFIELAPNQNSFGHMHRWLKHPRYAALAETHGEFTAWGQPMQGPFGLCPIDPGSLALVRDLYDELLPHFTSRMFNVGCDETIDLGQGRSRAECEARGSARVGEANDGEARPTDDLSESMARFSNPAQGRAARGTGRVYLDFLRKIYDEVKARGRTMQFWGDIIVQHPELIAELPRDAIALEWGYEANHPFDEHGAQFKAAGLQFYVCPGTSAWCSIAGRTHNALGNLRSAAENGLKHGATGYLITDWGDRGHWQMNSISDLGLAIGAAYAWNGVAARDLNVARVISIHAFDDPSGALGEAAYRLGNVYRALGLEPHNSSVLFWVMQKSPAEVRAEFGHTFTANSIARALAAIEEAVQPLSAARSTRPDAALIAREFNFTAQLLRHACRRAQWIMGQPSSPTAELKAELQRIIEDYRALWLARNRSGGLKDSVGRFEKALAEYD
ncbi:MAG: beta-N-acetylhexosaminidase [Anaerolineales bacterium]